MKICHGCYDMTVKTDEVVGAEIDGGQEDVLLEHVVGDGDEIHVCQVNCFQLRKLLDCFSNLLKTKTFY